MKHSLLFYIKPFLVIATVTMGIVCWIFGTPKTLNGWLGHIGTVSTVMGVISWVYIKLIWRYCLWEIVPRFAKRYKGEIRYKYGSGGTKEAEIIISQTLFFINVKLKTDEIKSNAITSDLIEENGSWFLYYTYIKEPQAAYSANNPIQRGAARLELKKPETGFLKHMKTIDFLDGTYWTSKGYMGDIKLIKEIEQ